MSVLSLAKANASHPSAQTTRGPLTGACAASVSAGWLGLCLQLGWMLLAADAIGKVQCCANHHWNKYNRGNKGKLFLHLHMHSLSNIKVAVSLVRDITTCLLVVSAKVAWLADVS